MSKDKSIPVSETQVQAALTDNSIKKPSSSVESQKIGGLHDRLFETIYLKSNYGHQAVTLKRLDDRGITIADGSINKFIPWHLVPEITY